MGELPHITRYWTKPYLLFTETSYFDFDQTPKNLPVLIGPSYKYTRVRKCDVQFYEL